MSDIEITFFLETALSRNYAEPTTTTSNGTSHARNGNNGLITNGTIHSQKSRTTTISDYYNDSVLSADTEHTYITSPGVTTAYIENCGSSIASNQSHDGGSSQVSLLNGNSSNGSQSTIACFGPDDFDGYYSGIPSVLEFNGTRLIFQGEIGRVSFLILLHVECCAIIVDAFRETMDASFAGIWNPSKMKLPLPLNCSV